MLLVHLSPKHWCMALLVATVAVMLLEEKVFPTLVPPLVVLVLAMAAKVAACA